jgi:hypothetical protein
MPWRIWGQMSFFGTRYCFSDRNSHLEHFDGDMEESQR